MIRDPEADINADPDSGVEVTAVKLFARVTGIGVAGVTITDDTPEDFDEDEC